MAIDFATFQLYFPELTDPPYTQTRVEFWLPRVEDCISESVFGKKYEMAVMFLTAHELVLEQQRLTAAQAGGVADAFPVKAESNQKLSYTAAIQDIDMTKGESLYMSTIYGKKFVEIRALVRVPGFFVSTC